MNVRILNSPCNWRLRLHSPYVVLLSKLPFSHLDFAKMMELFDKREVSFVSVTQQFNTTHSMGRLTLNILLSFAQFEREIISERTRDKVAATRKKGKWSGSRPILGYDADLVTNKLVINHEEATRVRSIFRLYAEHGSLLPSCPGIEPSRLDV